MVVRFCYDSYDYRPNWTPLSPITITYGRMFPVMLLDDFVAISHPLGKLIRFLVPGHLSSSFCWILLSLSRNIVSNLLSLC